MGNRGGYNKLNTDQFIEKAKTIHGDKYIYNKVEYKYSNEKVIITCKDHGEFLQTPNSHISGMGCHKCGVISSKNNKFLSQEEFIRRAKLKHGDKYDYSCVKYIGCRDKIIIKCPTHGEFLQVPDSHLNGSGCNLCGNIAIGKALALTEEEFIIKSKEVHGNKFNYNKLDYTNCLTKVKITCNEHGDFTQFPQAHLLGHIGCTFCKRINAEINRRDSQEEFVEKCVEKHGDRYDYSNIIYLGTKNKINVKCKEHGEFMSNAGNHLAGHGCPKCAVEYNTDRLRSTKEEFIEKAKIVHGSRYDYSKVEYTRVHNKVIIICRNKGHGEFSQEANSHLQGNGCPICSESKGERLIRNILIKNNIYCLKEYKIPLQKNRYKYDFYLPDYNLLIEFHGGQHYFPVKWFGGEDGFKRTRKRDIEKMTMAKDLKYKILVIPYTILKKLGIVDFEVSLIEDIKKKGKCFPKISIPIREKWYDPRLVMERHNYGKKI